MEYRSSDGVRREHCSRSFYTSFPLFFVYIILAAVGLCEITDEMTYKTAFRLCFNFYTPYTNIKTSAQNAPKCITARKKNLKILGRRQSSPQTSLPTQVRDIPS